MGGSVTGTIRLAALLSGLIGGPVLAQEAGVSSLPDDAQSYVGDWVLQQEDADAPACALTFTDQPAAGGWAVTLPDACPAPFPAAASLAVWNVDDQDGSILIMDQNRQVTLRLLSDPDGYYATADDSDPRFYLVAPYDENGEGGEQDAD